MTDYTIDDLVEAGTDDGAGDDGGGSGEWVMDLVDRLDEKGYLGPLIFGPDAAEIDDMDRQEPAPDAGADMGADDVKGALLQVYDRAEQIPGLSDDPTVGELIKLIDGNPEMADQLLNEYL